MKEEGKGLLKARKKGKAKGGAGAAFWLIALLLQWLARRAPGFGQWYAVRIYPLLVGSVGRAWGMIPFSGAEILLYLLILGFLAYGVTHLRQWKLLFFRAFLAAGILFFLFTVNCGINYYRRPFSDYLDYRPGKYSAEQLKELGMYLTEMVNRSADEKKAADEAADLGEESRRAMRRLGEKYPCLGGYYPPPKKLLFSWVLSVQQLAGIYSPFTVEANYNGDMVSYNIPHTACHELSHLKGFMREDEANFIGFLACAGSDSPEFRYSGYLAGWIYAGNALSEEDPEAYAAMWQALSEEVKEDLRANSAFWERFDTRAAKASEAMNDTYLRANSQPEGIKTYGRVVDLLLEWYQRGKKQFSENNL